MFDITDSGAVRELQKYLLELSYATHGYPHLAIDGIFGRETREVLSLFQRRARLPVTGVADRRTWQALYRAYLLAITSRMPDHKPRHPFLV
jgi:peptidoglycan hydrolase-like protein with peptidoglycan-binding domain